MPCRVDGNRFRGAVELGDKHTKSIARLMRRREIRVAQAEVQGQAAGYFPGIVHVRLKGVAAVIVESDRIGFAIGCGAAQQ